MCGIVAYIGGAANSLTRILTGMAAIIYRAPDSTGVAVFGDDREPIRTRKALGSVIGLIRALHHEGIYPNPEAQMLSLWTQPAGADERRQQQRRLIELEHLPLDVYDAVHRGQLSPPSYDDLVSSGAREAVRLTPGWPGNPGPLSPVIVKNPPELARLIEQLIMDYDLPPIAIHELIRSALSQTLKRFAASVPQNTAAEILAALHESFEQASLAPSLAIHDVGPPASDPKKQSLLWEYLAQTLITIPFQYDRDGVRGLFRLLEATLLSRLPHQPAAGQALQQTMLQDWDPAHRPADPDWRVLYGLEKAVNVYGRAASAALTYLYQEQFLPMRCQSVALPAQPCDPLVLRCLTPPILAHGRWAMQSAVTVENAHPFVDQQCRRVLALNGQFDSDVEREVHDFLKTVSGLGFRSENSAEYLPLLWGYYFDQLHWEQKRADAVRSQIETELDHCGIGSHAIDFNIYHRVKDKSIRDLDEQALIEAVRCLSRKGGQLAAAAASLLSPQNLYVISHQRPVFIVRRLDDDDVMVVSDINAAMGLFPQALIHEKTRELERLQARFQEELLRHKTAGAPAAVLHRLRKTHQEHEDRLLTAFTVEVYALEGPEVFARIERSVDGPCVRRNVTIANFDRQPLPEIEPFVSVIKPPALRSDLYQSFYEMHLNEIPDRLDEILQRHVAEDTGQVELNLRESLLHRRFGRGLVSLKRLILVGMGSSFHIGLLAAPLIRQLLPEVDVRVCMPLEFDDLSRSIDADQDLVVLLSWSATTSAMVEFAKRAGAHNMLMIGITEKVFADMALIAGRSVGLMALHSGEEVTISALKSSACMLLCLSLLGAWLARLAGRSQPAADCIQRLKAVVNGLDQMLADEQLKAFCQKLAHEAVGSHAAFVIDGSPLNGVGREAALKLEENSWTALGRIVDYRDLDLRLLRREFRQNLVVVNATYRTRFQEALTVMRRLYEAGIPFAAVTFAGRELHEVKRYSRGWVMCLAAMDDDLPAFPALLFFYMLAFYFSQARGRSKGEFPRNRVKSITASRAESGEMFSAGAELLRMKADNWSNELTDREALAQAPAGLSAVSLWERSADNQDLKNYYRQMRNLGVLLVNSNPLKAVTEPSSDFDPLGRMIFGRIAEGDEIVWVPLDFAAAQAAYHVADQWGPTLGCRMSVVLDRDLPRRFSDHALHILTAAQEANVEHLAPLLEQNPQRVLWFGPQPTGAACRMADPTARVVFTKPPPSLIASEFLYMALTFFLLQLWHKQAPAKASILEAHLRPASQVLDTILNHTALKPLVSEVIRINQNYKTASFITASAGLGMNWTARFDAVGGWVMNWHRLGVSAHGPLVTVDSRVEDKFIRLEPRQRMVDQFGDHAVEAWERRYFRGQRIDQLPAAVPRQSKSWQPAPFFALGHWYLPELRPDYDTANDNLIFLDATSERCLTQAMDELATFCSRYPRLVLISQESFWERPSAKSIGRYPISHVILLPAMNAKRGPIPISRFLLPLAMNILAAEAAAAGAAASR